MGLRCVRCVSAKCTIQIRIWISSGRSPCGDIVVLALTVTVHIPVVSRLAGVDEVRVRAIRSGRYGFFVKGLLWWFGWTRTWYVDSSRDGWSRKRNQDLTRRGIQSRTVREGLPRRIADERLRIG